MKKLIAVLFVVFCFAFSATPYPGVHCGYGPGDFPTMYMCSGIFGTYYGESYQDGKRCLSEMGGGQDGCYERQYARNCDGEWLCLPWDTCTEFRWYAGLWIGDPECGGSNYGENCEPIPDEIYAEMDAQMARDGWYPIADDTNEQGMLPLMCTASLSEKGEK